ncbi:accessory factor UbiK family protein [Zymobacter sp. IVIA_5232.4 C2]|uniref:accessory factor UbiK family protein n=1 Tax=Zymobacter sp. IVIA_5232.4 C2 TaxID=3394855 RepID=UPI0039C1C25D
MPRNNDIFNQFFGQFSEKLSQFSAVPDSVKQSMHGAMRSAFDRMDLVSREEFDIMQSVLERTRNRLETLERRIDVLEKQLDAQRSSADDEHPGEEALRDA